MDGKLGVGNDCCMGWEPARFGLIHDLYVPEGLREAACRASDLIAVVRWADARLPQVEHVFLVRLRPLRDPIAQYDSHLMDRPPGPYFEGRFHRKWIRELAMRDPVVDRLVFLWARGLIRTFDDLVGCVKAHLTPKVTDPSSPVESWP